MILMVYRDRDDESREGKIRGRYIISGKLVYLFNRFYFKRILLK